MPIASDPDIDAACTALGIAPATLATWSRQQKEDFLLARVRRMRSSEAAPFAFTAWATPPGPTWQEYAYKVITLVFGVAALAGILGLFWLAMLLFDGTNQQTAGYWIQVALYVALAATALVLICCLLPDNVIGFDPRMSRSLEIVALIVGALLGFGLYFLLADDTIGTNATRIFLWVVFPITTIVHTTFTVAAIQR